MTDLAGTPAEVGEWMADTAMRVWFQYDDEGTFVGIKDVTGPVPIYTFKDVDEDKTLTISAEDFFKAHKRLIWNAQIDNYRHDWIEFAFKSKGVDADEYDDNTVDAVLQNLLYGDIIYG